MKTTKTAAAYLATLALVLFWVCLLKLACKLDKETRLAVAAGERIDHVDDAIARLDALHVELFGGEDD
jgi:hypothetical protein